MNLVLLLSIISATQLSNAFGKSPTEAKMMEDPLVTPPVQTRNVDDGLRTRRNSDYDDDFLINRLSREYVTSNLLDSAAACNKWPDDVESDTMIESALRRLFDVGCLEYCRLKVLSDINDMLKCADLGKSYARGTKRSRLVLSNADDLFMPVRGRRSDQAPQLVAEKKAQLDFLVNDLFLPHRGRRDMDRKNAQRNPSAKRTGFELNERDFFVPNRGKRPKANKDITANAEKFIPQWTNVDDDLQPVER